MTTTKLTATTKRIVYDTPDGPVVLTPNHAARLVAAIDGNKLNRPTPIGRIRAIAVDMGLPFELSEDDIQWAETEDDFLARVWAREKEVARQVRRDGRLVNPHLNDSTPFRVIEFSDLPDDRTDRTFRNAWRLQGGRVVVEMEAAKSLWRDKIRAQRAPMLAKLDADQVRALVAKDQAAVDAIEAEKQRLRDAPAHPDIIAAQTPEQLRAVAPLVPVAAKGPAR